VKKILKQKINLNNQALIGAVALILAVSLFAFWRTFLQIHGQVSYQQIPKSESSQTTAQDSPKTFVKIPILIYHHIGNLPAEADAVRKDLTVSPENFEIQAAWLKSQGFQSVLLNDLLALKNGKFTLPEKPIIFTFDDGYEDALENASKILIKYGFKGSFGIITQFPGIKSGTNSYASWQQIKLAGKRGMEIVSHTQDHFDGTSSKYSEGFILRNLSDSRKDIKANLNIDTNILIYPFGRFNDRYIELAKQAGFEIGLTTKDSKVIFLDNLMKIPRLRVSPYLDLEQFKKLVLE
jgi:peptidoglycan/xylan/chitin deacetylase (PgdA/CDA1 family)